ncbi:MAG: NuoI/complex I 23 kDa subunit family protein [Candidatus Eiseniibacteriota bacterium]
MTDTTETVAYTPMPRPQSRIPLRPEALVPVAPPPGRAGVVPPNAPVGERPSYWLTVKGLLITLRNMTRSIVSRRNNPTVYYPEERRPFSPRFRGIHQLTKRPDGTLKCVACFMCATICPAECITIESGEHPNKKVEKYPVRFDIDMLRCVMCGLCVDACPEEAIIMTQDYEMAAATRAETVYPISLLADRPQLLTTPPGYRPRYEPGPELVR